MPNKALWANEKTSIDVSLKSPDTPTESIMGLGFHNSGPERIPVKAGEQSPLIIGQAGGQASALRVQCPWKGWLMPDHQAQCTPGVLTTAIYHQSQQLKGQWKHHSKQ